MAEQNSHQDPRTVAERIRAQLENLTRAERQLANVMLENYPVSGLGSITVVAKSAGVSTATVARLAKTLGYPGVREVRIAIRAEMREKIVKPVATPTPGTADGAPNHPLNRFAGAVVDNLSQTLNAINLENFDKIARLIADDTKHLHIVGGRVTGAMANYFFTHMQILRDGMTMIAANSNTWPHFILNMKKGDVLVAFDIRRYEHDIQRMAQMAAEKDVTVILITDQWGSPEKEFATYTLNSAIEVRSPPGAPASWDSSVSILFLIEALIDVVRAQNCAKSTARIQELEELFNRTKLFRKFV